MGQLLIFRTNSQITAMRWKRLLIGETVSDRSGSITVVRIYLSKPVSINLDLIYILERPNITETYQPIHIIYTGTTHGN